MKELRLFKSIDFYGKEKVTVRLSASNDTSTTFQDHEVDAEAFYALVEDLKQSEPELDLQA